jgi:hypothetical protein
MEWNSASVVKTLHTHSRWSTPLDRGVNIFHNARIRSRQLSAAHQPQQRPTRFRTTVMNRHLVTVITPIGSQGRCDAVPMAKPAGLLASFAYAHDFGRESDDTNTSGEGPG